VSFGLGVGFVWLQVCAPGLVHILLAAGWADEEEAGRMDRVGKGGGVLRWGLLSPPGLAALSQHAD
jgi:hypothetical protein